MSAKHSQHAARRASHRRRLAGGVVALLLLGGWSAAALADTPPAAPRPDPAPASTVVIGPTRPVPEAEMVYLEELRFSGLELTAAEQETALEIAREHVSHGHLVGMRYWITDDFYYRIPRLTTEQRDVARVAVEHHFLAVTGRKQ